MASKQFPIRRGIHTSTRNLCITFSLNYNRNTVGYSSHDSGEQKENHETFGTEHEAQPQFSMKKCVCF